MRCSLEAWLGRVCRSGQVWLAAPRTSVSFEINELTQRTFGSASTSNALTSWVHGSAISAPIGPNTRLCMSLAARASVPWSVFATRPCIVSAPHSSIRPITDAVFMRLRTPVQPVMEFPSVAACGAMGSNLRATALNDYRVDLPFEDTQRFDVLLARLLDDKPMTVRDKGPLFIIYPFDSSAELRTTVYFSRSAWQLKMLEIQ